MNQKFIVLVGTKLHRIVIKLAVETKNTSQSQSQSQRSEIQQINLRDELFWFGRPRLLLRLIQFISFQVIEANKNLYDFICFSLEFWQLTLDCRTLLKWLRVFGLWYDPFPTFFVLWVSLYDTVRVPHRLPVTKSEFQLTALQDLSLQDQTIVFVCSM